MEAMHVHAAATCACGDPSRDAYVCACPRVARVHSTKGLVHMHAGSSAAVYAHVCVHNLFRSAHMKRYSIQ